MVEFIITRVFVPFLSTMAAECFECYGYVHYCKSVGKPKQECIL